MTENKIFAVENAISCRYNYAISLPEGYTKEKQYPILFFLHGAGERGDDPSVLYVHGPLKKIARGETFDCIVVAPQCPEGSYWITETQTLKLFMDTICEEYNVDRKRVYLTGLSMGGFGTWMMGTRYPDYFAAIIPICGGGMPWAAWTMSKLPIWAFHGTADTAVAPHCSVEMVEAVNIDGGIAKLTMYEGVGHDCWTETYDNPEVWQWLFS
ncbi:MAG: dienelactone hydrolase family protein, partial [Clostridia bacterium]|nr:dienelactone hydrolase family protein [Clostridia bacterium]